jgi:hypothetical protein
MLMNLNQLSQRIERLKMKSLNHAPPATAEEQLMKSGAALPAPVAIYNGTLYETACRNLPKLSLEPDSPTGDLLEAELRVQLGEEQTISGLNEFARQEILFQRASALNPGRCLTLSIEQDLDPRPAIDIFSVSIYKDACGNCGTMVGSRAVYQAKMLAIPGINKPLSDWNVESLLEMVHRSRILTEAEPVPLEKARDQLIRHAYCMSQLRYLTLRSYLPSPSETDKRYSLQLATCLFTDLNDGRRRPEVYTINMWYDHQKKVTLYDNGAR